MNQRPTLDARTFERLLLAAWILQCRVEQEARNRPPAKEQALPPEVTVIASNATQPTRTSPPVTQPSVCAPPSRTAILQARIFAKFAQAATHTIASFPGRRIKVKFAVSSRAVIAAAGVPLLTLALAGLLLLQISHQGRFSVVASTTENNAAGRATLLSELAIRPASHREITDDAAQISVSALSRYEVGSLRRQAYYGDDSAAMILGMLYETGKYVPQDCRQAAVWMTRAANWGNVAAQYNLALRYRDGDGVTANTNEAQKWLHRAANRRYTKAVQMLQLLASRQTDSGSPTP